MSFRDLVEDQKGNKCVSNDDNDRKASGISDNHGISNRIAVEITTIKFVPPLPCRAPLVVASGIYSVDLAAPSNLAPFGLGLSMRRHEGQRCYLQVCLGRVPFLFV